MATKHSNRTKINLALRVPRFVTVLNRIAEGAGFTTEVRIDTPRQGEPEIVSIWRGSRTALRQLGFLPDSELRKVHSAGDYYGAPISWPSSPGDHPAMAGRMRRARGALEILVDGGHLPSAIRTEGAIEIIEYADEIAHHGSKEALIIAGICTDRQFPNKHTRKTAYYYDTSKKWVTQRYPDGSFVHWLESDSAHQNRVEARQQEELRQNLQPAACGDPSLAKLTSEDDYRRMLQSFIPMLINSDPNCFSKFDGLKSIDGHVYGLMPESREQIEDAIRGFYFALRDVEVYRRKYDARTDKEKATARRVLAKAEADPKFQRFMGTLGLPRPGGAQ